MAGSTQVSLEAVVNLRARKDSLKKIIADLEEAMSNVDPSSALGKNLAPQLKKVKTMMEDMEILSGSSFIDENDHKRFTRMMKSITDTISGMETRMGSRGVLSSFLLTGDEEATIARLESEIDTIGEEMKKATAVSFEVDVEGIDKAKNLLKELKDDKTLEISDDATISDVSKQVTQQKELLALQKQQAQQKTVQTKQEMQAAEAEYQRYAKLEEKTYLEDQGGRKLWAQKRLAESFKDGKLDTMSAKETVDSYFSGGRGKAGSIDALTSMAEMMGIDLGDVKHTASQLRETLFQAFKDADEKGLSNEVASNFTKDFSSEEAKKRVAEKAGVKDYKDYSKKREELQSKKDSTKTAHENAEQEFLRLDTLESRMSELENSLQIVMQNLQADLSVKQTQAQETLKNFKETIRQQKIAPMQEVAQRSQELRHDTAAGQSEHDAEKRAEEEAARAAKQQEMEDKAFQERLSQSIKQWMGVRDVVNYAKQGLREAWQDIQGLDKAMTNIAVVTDFSVGDLWGKIGEYMDIAQQYGVTTQGVYEVSQLYYQQGLGDADTMAATTETLKMARIAGMGYQDAADGMTVAIRGFKMEMTDAAHVTDVYSKVAAVTASDTQELVSAMSKTASSAESVGSEFETTTAMLAVMIEATRESPENIGSAMKSIISRYGELTKEAKIDTDGEIIDYNKVDTALKSVGISLKDSQGQFRDFDVVVEELASKWDSLDSVTQRYIATTFAGNRQQSRFLALVGNYERYMEVKEAAENAEDAGLLQYSKTLDSMETKLNNIKTNFQQFYMSIFDGEAAKGFLDFINGALEGLNNLSSGKGIGALITSITPLFSMIRGGKVLAGGLTNTFGYPIAQLGARNEKFVKEGQLWTKGAIARYAAQEAGQTPIQTTTMPAKGRGKNFLQKWFRPQASQPQTSQLQSGSLTPNVAGAPTGNTAQATFSGIPGVPVVNVTVNVVNPNGMAQQLILSDKARMIGADQLVPNTQGQNKPPITFGEPDASGKKRAMISPEAAVSGINEPTSVTKPLVFPKKQEQSQSQPITKLDTTQPFQVNSTSSQPPMINTKTSWKSWGRTKDGIYKGSLVSSGLAIGGGILSAVGTGVAKNNLGLGHGISMLGDAANFASIGAQFGPIGAAIGAAAGLIKGIATWPSELEKTQQKLDQAKEKAEEANLERAEKQNRANTLEAEIKNLKKLEKAQHDSEEAQQEYIDAQNKMAESFPELVTGYDEAGNAIIDLVAAEASLTQARRDATQAAIEAAEDAVKASAAQIDVDEKNKSYSNEQLREFNDGKALGKWRKGSFVDTLTGLFNISKTEGLSEELATLKKNNAGLKDYFRVIEKYGKKGLLFSKDGTPLSSADAYISFMEENMLGGGEGYRKMSADVQSYFGDSEADKKTLNNNIRSLLKAETRGTLTNQELLLDGDLEGTIFSIEGIYDIIGEMAVQEMIDENKAKGITEEKMLNEDGTVADDYKNQVTQLTRDYSEEFGQIVSDLTNMGQMDNFSSFLEEATSGKLSKREIAEGMSRFGFNANAEDGTFDREFYDQLTQPIKDTSDITTRLLKENFGSYRLDESGEIIDVRQVTREIDGQERKIYKGPEGTSPDGRYYIDSDGNVINADTGYRTIFSPEEMIAEYEGTFMAGLIGVDGTFSTEALGTNRINYAEKFGKLGLKNITDFYELLSPQQLRSFNEQVANIRKLVDSGEFTREQGEELVADYIGIYTRAGQQLNEEQQAAFDRVMSEGGDLHTISGQETMKQALFDAGADETTIAAVMAGIDGNPMEASIVNLTTEYAAMQDSIIGNIDATAEMMSKATKGMSTDEVMNTLSQNKNLNWEDFVLGENGEWVATESGRHKMRSSRMRSMETYISRLRAERDQVYEEIFGTGEEPTKWTFDSEEGKEVTLDNAEAIDEFLTRGREAAGEGMESVYDFYSEHWDNAKDAWEASDENVSWADFWKDYLEELDNGIIEHAQQVFGQMEEQTELGGRQTVNEAALRAKARVRGKLNQPGYMAEANQNIRTTGYRNLDLEDASEILSQLGIELDTADNEGLVKYDSDTNTYTLDTTKILAQIDKEIVELSNKAERNWEEDSRLNTLFTQRDALSLGYGASIDSVNSNLKEGFSQLSSGLEGTLTGADYTLLAQKYGVSEGRYTVEGFALSEADQKNMLANLYIESGFVEGFGKSAWESMGGKGFLKDISSVNSEIDAIQKALVGGLSDGELIGYNFNQQEAEAYLNVLLQIRDAAMLDENAYEFNFMDQEVANGNLKNFDNFVGQIDKVKSSMAALNKGEYIDYKDFINMMDFMDNISGGALSNLEKEIDSSLPGLQALQQQLDLSGHSYQDFVNIVLENTDEWGKVDIGGVAMAMGISVDAAASMMAEGMTDGLKEVARQQIKYLSGVEKMLLAMQALEQAGDVEMGISITGSGGENLDFTLDQLEDLQEQWKSLGNDSELIKQVKLILDNFDPFFGALFGDENFDTETFLFGKDSFNLSEANVKIADEVGTFFKNLNLADLNENQLQYLAQDMWSVLGQYADFDDEGNFTGWLEPDKAREAFQKYIRTRDFSSIPEVINAETQQKINQTLAESNLGFQFDPIFGTIKIDPNRKNDQEYIEKVKNQITDAYKNQGFEVIDIVIDAEGNVTVKVENITVKKVVNATGEEWDEQIIEATEESARQKFYTKKDVEVEVSNEAKVKLNTKINAETGTVTMDYSKNSKDSMDASGWFSNGTPNLAAIESSIEKYWGGTQIKNLNVDVEAGTITYTFDEAATSTMDPSLAILQGISDKLDAGISLNIDTSQVQSATEEISALNEVLAILNGYKDSNISISVNVNDEDSTGADGESLTGMEGKSRDYTINIKWNAEDYTSLMPPNTKTVYVDFVPRKIPQVKWTGNMNNISGTAYANGNVGALTSGARLANKTLVGELGPELAVYGDRYHLLGQNGAEFVDLPKDALVFNHLQTAGILSGQMKNARATAVFPGSAMVNGNVSGPAAAGGIGAALAAVRRAKSVWQGLLDSLSAADLMGGGGGGGGGGNDLKAHIADLQEWYNLSRQIADIEQRINTLLAKRENISDGHKYLQNLRETQALLEDQVNTQQDLLKYQEDQLAAQAEHINNHELWSQFLTVDENGLLQYIEGNETNGGKGALQVLDEMNKMSGEEQVAFLEKLGYTYTDNDGKELEEGELVAKFYEELQKQIDDYDALRDTVAETEGALEELETSINEIDQEIRQNEIDLSQEIYDIIVDSWKENIDNLKEQNDLIKEANEAYAQGIEEAIAREKEQYDQNTAIQDREQLQRQLSLLRRSGGSASEIADLEQQLDETLKDEYFRKQEEALKNIQDANERQTKLMEQQVKMQEEALQYEQENGIIWTKVYEVLQGTDAEILAFMQGHHTKFFEQSALQQEDMLLEWAKKVGIFNEEKAYQAFQKEAAANFGRVWETEKGQELKSVWDSLSEEEKEKLQREYYDQKYAQAVARDGKSEEEAETFAQKEFFDHLVAKKKRKEDNEKQANSEESENSESENNNNQKGSKYYYYAYYYSDGENGKKVYNSLGGINSDDPSLSDEYVRKNVREAPPGITPKVGRTTRYATGGIIDFTGPAWVDGSKSKPERILSAEQNQILEEGLAMNAGRGNALKEALTAFATSQMSSIREVFSRISSSMQSQTISIAPGAVVVNVDELANGYDVDELYNDITEKLYSIASKSSSRGVNRR